MTPAEVRRLNRALAAHGARICRDCGRRLPLDAFPVYVTAGRAHRRHQCRDCYNAYQRERQCQRWHSDGAVREQRAAYARAYRAAHLDSVRAANRRRMAAYRQRRKTRGYARIIGWHERSLA